MKKYLKEVGASLVAGSVLMCLVSPLSSTMTGQKVDESAEMVLGACAPGVGFPLTWKTSCPFPPFESINYGALIGDVIIWSIVVYAVIMIYRKLKK